MKESGFKQFAELVGEIESSEPYVYPSVQRSRSMDWTAYIFDHHDKERQTKLAGGQAQSMEEACALCVANYRERERIKDRMEELLKEPVVQEAMEIFKKEWKS